MVANGGWNGDSRKPANSDLRRAGEVCVPPSQTGGSFAYPNIPDISVECSASGSPLIGSRIIMYSLLCCSFAAGGMLEKDEGMADDGIAIRGIGERYYMWGFGLLMGMYYFLIRKSCGTTRLTTGVAAKFSIQPASDRMCLMQGILILFSKLILRKPLVSI